MKFKLISMYVSNSFIINQTISANEKRQITPPLSFFVFFRLFLSSSSFFSFRTKIVFYTEFLYICRQLTKNRKR